MHEKFPLKRHWSGKYLSDVSNLCQFVENLWLWWISRSTLVQIPKCSINVYVSIHVNVSLHVNWLQYLTLSAFKNGKKLPPGPKFKFNKFWGPLCRKQLQMCETTWHVSYNSHRKHANVTIFSVCCLPLLRQ